MVAMGRMQDLVQGRLAVILLGLVVVLQLYVLSGRSSQPRLDTKSMSSSLQYLKENAQAALSSPPDPISRNWEYVYTRDSRNPALSRDQCQIAFPKLFRDLERGVAYWDDHGHIISQKDTDISWCTRGCVRALTYENELRILETRNTHHFDDHHDSRRVIYTLSQINRALLGATARGEIMPNIEFAIAVQDYIELPDDEHDTHTIWTYDRKVGTRKDERMWLMPDFNFWAWHKGIHNSYTDATRRLISHDAPLSSKIPQLAWRGDAGFSQLRKDLLATANDKSWADVKSTWIDFDDFCRYLFTIYTEGHAWSGRLKYMLNCNSIAIVHELEFLTFYHHLLIPDGPEQNFVSVKRDWSDLEEKVQYYLGHPEEAERIVTNSVETFRERYLTPAAEACHFRELMRRYREVSFEPDAFEEKGPQVKRLRGVAYELFNGDGMDSVAG
ncbi:hypothetical protein DOTSEDRAFT_71425 [Dothistroma septosporum NZE10]|uniref:Glycosyl transferase CAP10 domain-containing protein n=1 Tax=Dothistroma septosporum (strain NZE10 / CBS 128990) TaxID=675120 RepID=N1PTN8_DOTSN|nr:hypothetical protein DOTSEDRAFT_71425 [Dothistroma septosporum NZE10]